MSSQVATVTADGEQATPDSASLGRRAKFLMLLVELALVLGVAYLWDIEGRRQFFPVLGLIAIGAAIHACLPRQLRLWFFAMLSMGMVLFVLGWRNGASVLGVGGGLIAICYLPVRMLVRVLLLMAAGGVLIAVRHASVSPVWVVVGSMFMFRLAIYLFDNRRDRTNPPLASTLSYFFMLPNVLFLFFPVVDYRTFLNTYYSDDEWAITQRGIGWILRGITHLLLYRYIWTYIVPAPYEIQNVWTVWVYVLSNYALYLEVSGQFHVITGILHLFGFNLPRTHYLFFLASSVSDIWRRINIYWKDFLEKLVFLPSYFTLRRRGVRTQTAIVIGVFAVFVATWLLHSWQTFWLLGEFPIVASHALLWLGVGACVAVNSLLEYRRSNRRVKAAPRPQWQSDLRLSLQTVGMLTAVSLFWACWTNSLFLRMVGNLLSNSPHAADGWAAVLLSAGGLVLGGMVFLSLRRFLKSRQSEPATVSYRDTFALHAIALGALVVVGMPGFARMFDSRTTLTIEGFRSDIYAQSDPFTELQSYYEDLDTVTVQGGSLLSRLTPQRVNRRSIGNEFAQLTRQLPQDPLLELEFIPGWTGTLDGQPVSINKFGMRDRKTITIEKPPHTLRIAFVGSSVVMGYSVADDEVCNLLFEDELNDAWGTPSRHFQVLNFATGRHWALHRRVLIDRKVLAFDPDALFYFAHQDEQQGPLVHLTGLVSEQVPLPYNFLNDIIRDAGITPDMPPGVIQGELTHQIDAILEGIYRSIVDTCRERGIVPVYVYLPVPDVPNAPDLSGVLIPMAQRAGFVVLDLQGWYGTYKPAEVKPFSSDHHLNTLGHRLVAEQLFEAVRRHPEALPPEAQSAATSEP